MLSVDSIKTLANFCLIISIHSGDSIVGQRLLKVNINIYSVTRHYKIKNIFKLRNFSRRYQSGEKINQTTILSRLGKTIFTSTYLSSKHFISTTYTIIISAIDSEVSKKGCQSTLWNLGDQKWEQEKLSTALIMKINWDSQRPEKLCTTYCPPIQSVDFLF